MVTKCFVALRTRSHLPREALVWLRNRRPAENLYDQNSACGVMPWPHEANMCFETRRASRQVGLLALFLSCASMDGAEKSMLRKSVIFVLLVLSCCDTSSRV